MGALSELTKAHNWQQIDGMTPDAAALLMAQSFETLIIDCMAGGDGMLVYVTRDTAIGPFTANVWTKIDGLEDVAHDSGEWDAANDKVTVGSDGLYVVAFHYRGITHAVAFQTAVYVNGSPIMYADRASNSYLGYTSAVFFLPLSDGDEVEFYLRMSGASNLSLNGPSGIGMMVWQAEET